MVTFPRTDIMDLHRVASVGSFKPRRRDAVSRTSRQSFAKELAEPLWTASLTSEPLPFGNAMALQAALESLRGPMNAAEIYDARLDRPQSYTGGSTGGATIAGVQNGNELSLNGLPLDLTPGDCLAFDWGAGPARALHRVLEPVSSGSTAWFAVEPGIIPGWSAGASVVLWQPAMIAQLAGEFETRQVNGREVVVTTEWVQVIL
jgi:hypothetical protein